MRYARSLGGLSLATLAAAGCRLPAEPRSDSAAPRDLAMLRDAGAVADAAGRPAPVDFATPASPPDLGAPDAGGGGLVPLLLKPAVFAPAASYLVGKQPSALAAGDFDGDGHLDVAVANSGSDSLMVLPGRGDGTFPAAFAYPTGHAPAALGAGHFAGDARSDLVVLAGVQPGITLFVGKPNGLQLATIVPVCGGASLAVGDLNADGNPDVAVGGCGVSVLLGDGKGGLSAAHALGPAASAETIALGDLDGDGRDDAAIAFASPPRSSGLWLRHALPSGLLGAPGDVGAWHTPAGVAIADLDSDGWPDVVVSDFGAGSIGLVLGGMGGLRPGLAVPAGDDPAALAVGDFNGDGRRDLAVLNPGHDRITILLGDGKGGFPVSQAIPVGDTPVAIVALDLDGDRRTDLVIADSAGNDLNVLMNRTR